MKWINFFAVLFFGCSFLCGCERNNGAPVAEISVRQAWGQAEFDCHWDYVKEWIESSELISESIGEIQDVAPVGKPNEKFYSFAESWSDMNLEVIGAKGTGVLSLEGFNVGWSKKTGEVYRFHDDATFETKHRKEIICESGKGYLDEFQVDHMYNELLNYPADEDPETFLQKWELFQNVVTTIFSSHQSPSGRRPPLQGLKIYRKPLLVKRAALLDGWKLNNEAVLAHRDVAEHCLEVAQWEVWNDSPDRELATNNLKTALQSLRAANELEPDNKEILKLARQRLSLHRQLQDGSESGHTKSVFYKAAAREVKSISYLKRELGRFSVCEKTSRMSNVRVSKKLRYYTTVYLKLDGTWDDGTVAFRFWESDRLPPVDLFAENPRRPRCPLVYKSPKWKSESGEKVKISAKTGEPL